MLTNATGTRQQGLIDMDTTGRLPRAIAANICRPDNALAHSVIEDQDTIGTKTITKKIDRLRIIEARNLFVVVEVPHLGTLINKGKARTNERKPVPDRTTVGDLDLDRLRQRCALRFASGRIIGIGSWFLPRGREIVQLRRDEWQSSALNIVV